MSIETTALAESRGRAARQLTPRIAMTLIESRPILLLVLIALLVGFMSWAKPHSFPTIDNWEAVLLNASVAAILVVGMMILLIGGTFDLSIGGILALTGVVAGVLYRYDQFTSYAAILVALGVGALCGLVNGIIVTRIRINALIATLATLGIFRGITQLTQDSGVAPIGDGFAAVGQTTWLGFQTPFWIMLAVVILAAVAVSQTRFFRQYYYIGGNERAARLSGIKTTRLVLLAFVLMGVLAGLAGVLTAARLDAATISAGIGLELSVITAAILGGASLKGGEGTVIGGVLGVLFIALIQNALIILQVNVFWQNIVIGGVLLVAVSLDRWKQVSRT